MKSHKSTFVTLLIILISISNSLGQDFAKQRKQAEDKFNEGKIEESISISQKILQAAEKKFGKEHPEYAKSLQDLGVYYYLNYDNDKAKFFLENALLVYSKNPGKNSIEYITCMSDFAGVLMANGEYVNAEKSFSTCKEIMVSLSKTGAIDYAIILNNLAEVKRSLGKMDEAEKLYLETKKQMEELNVKSSPEYASLLNNIANFYHDQYDYINANKYYLNSLEVYKSMGSMDTSAYTNVLKNYSLMLIDIGKIEEAKVGIEDVMLRYEISPGKESMEYAGVLNDYAYLFKKAGNYKVAEKYYLQAKDLKERLVGMQSPSYWTTTNNLAMLYGDLGNYDKGIESLTSTINLMKEAGSGKTPQLALYLNNRSTLYQHKGNFKKAELDLDESLVLTKELYGEQHPDYSRVLNNLALIYNEEKDYGKAESFYLKSLSILQKDSANNAIEVAETYHNLGGFYSFNKNYDKAESYFKNALNTYEQMYGVNHPEFAVAMEELAYMYYRAGRYDKVNEIEKKAQDLTIKLLFDNFSFLTENEKVMYWNRAQTQFEFYNSFCLKAYKKYPSLVSEMFNYTLETKSLIMHHSNLVKKGINEQGNKSLIEKFKTWEDKKEKLAGYYNLKKSELKKNNIDITALENEVQKLEKELTIASEEFSIIRPDKKKTWEDIRAKLKSNEAAVEILRIESFGHDKIDSIVYVALIVTKETTGNPALVILSDGDKMEKKHLKSYRNSIKYDKVTSEHYNVYWKEIDKFLQDKEIIYVSPSGVYNKISIPSLKMPNGKYVIESKQIQIMTGLRNIISYNSNKFNKSNSAVLFGYPNYDMDLSKLYQSEKSNKSVSANLNLGDEIRGANSLNELPGTKVEVEKIYEILFPLGLNVKKYLGDEALESKIKSLKNPKILHIATHGYFLEDSDLKEDSLGITFTVEKSKENPLLRSGLLLSGANQTLNYGAKANNIEDGILTAYEAMNLDLSQTELVILSACETGLGEERNGEGVFGLQRSFQMAGAKNILMSLWQVSDAGTQELMILFYKNWASTKNAPLAYRQAQLELMKKYPSPYYWAAFVCVGY